MIQTSAIIVGAGPIGLELAVALKKAGIDYVQLEAGQVGQTIHWYPNQTQFFSSPEHIAIAGIPFQTQEKGKVTREEYLAYLNVVVDQHVLDIQVYERVVELQQDPETLLFTLIAKRGGERRIYTAEHVILAIGDMHRPRMLHIPGEDLPHVSHYLEQPEKYKDHKLLIVGGRNAAVEAAIQCNRAGAHVTMCHSRERIETGVIKYWLMPELEGLMKKGEIRFHPLTRPVSITRKEVTLVPCDSGGRDRASSESEQIKVEAEHVLIMTGYITDYSLLEMVGVPLVGESRTPKFDDNTMMTDVPNLYIAGTAVAGSQSHYRLFIEDCHIHVTKIVHAITDKTPEREMMIDIARDYGVPDLNS